MNRKIAVFLLLMLLYAFGMPSIASPCGSTTPPVTYTVPVEVPYDTAYYDWSARPGSFTAVNFWMQALQVSDQTGVSKVEVDYMRMYCRDTGGVDTLTQSREYNAIEDPFESGGLFIRSPWYENNTSEAMPVQFDLINGYVFFYPNTQYDRVWSLWSPGETIPANTNYCWMEARVWIHGPATVQAGMEFWQDETAAWTENSVNNVLLWVSDWFFESSGWQIISVFPLI
ncbi:MAG TPA: hypothetical protein ENG83_12175 [Nitrospirae bacterium]|nr:hypothetical protein BMS3Abin06_02876 [bacterium BMS3Abin06]HDH12932.1 hypothetical protein [Nitrospirota bacterium]HDL19857.1 hypothetical protein [Nitrospirota bacterium]HDZ01656.1 hypothetical protein [Nitrospirota bacterium]